MIIAGFILSIIGIIFLIFSIFSDDRDLRHILVMFGIIGLLLGTNLWVSEFTEKGTTIRCLKNNPPYKMEIKYELKDSVYIPCDTIYVKID
jgi:hypothetical protein